MGLELKCTISVAGGVTFRLFVGWVLNDTGDSEKAIRDVIF